MNRKCLVKYYFWISVFCIATRKQSFASQCIDIPLTLIGEFAENLSPGNDTVLFNFTMNMDGVTLTLDPDDDYVELRIQDNECSIILASTFSLNVLNPRSSLPAQLKNSLNYDLICEHEQGASTQTPVFITITEVNDFPPEFFCSPYQKNISELTPVGTTVFVAQGLSYDEDIEGGISGYEINGSNYFDGFGRYSRGVIVVTEELDYESGPIYHKVNITAKDIGNPQRSTTTYIIFDVTDGDDQSPTFSHEIYNLSLPENDSSLIGQYFTTSPPIFAYDLDFGINETVYYYIDPGVDFVIDDTTGQISPKTVLDRESKNFYDLHLEAYQGDKPVTRRTEADLYIYVTDVNDNTPEMSQIEYTVRVQEHTNQGTAILIVSATDMDEGINAELGYVLINCNSGAVDINNITGEIMVTNTKEFDREPHEEIICEVFARELHTAEKWESNISTVTILLQDVNDNTPNFTQNVYETTVLLSEALAGVTVIQVTANDIDVGVNREVRYAISDTFSDAYESYFSANETTGVVYVKIDLPYEDDIHTIELAVIATDQADITNQQRSDLSKVMIEVIRDVTIPTVSHTTDYSTPLTTRIVTKSTESHLSSTTEEVTSASSNRPTVHSTSIDNVQTTDDVVTDKPISYSGSSTPAISSSSSLESTTYVEAISTCECYCNESTTDFVPIVPKDDEDSFIVLMIVIGLLSVLILFLLVLIICVVLRSQKQYSERVDKATTKTSNDVGVQGINWSQCDTKSLLEHQEYMAHMLPTVFSTLDNETNTETMRAVPRPRKGETVSSTSTNHSKYKESDDFSLYRIPIDSVQNQSMSLPNRPSIISSTRPNNQNDNIDLNKHAPIKHNTPEAFETENDYAYLNPIDITSEISNTTIPKLDLSKVTDVPDDDSSFRPKHISTCREEESIEIDIPCDSPRSSNPTPVATPRGFSTSDDVIFIEITPSSPEVMEVGEAPPNCIIGNEEFIHEEHAEGLSESAASIIDDDYVDMGQNKVVMRQKNNSESEKNVNAKPGSLTSKATNFNSEQTLDPSKVSIGRINSSQGKDTVSVSTTSASSKLQEIEDSNKDGVSVAGLNMLDDVIAEEERMSERNSASYPDDALTCFTFAGDDEDGYQFDTVKRVKPRDSLAESSKYGADKSEVSATSTTKTIATIKENESKKKSDLHVNQSETNTGETGTNASVKEYPPYSLVQKTREPKQV